MLILSSAQDSDIVPGCGFCEEQVTGLAFDPILMMYGAPGFKRLIWSDEKTFIIPSLGPLTGDHYLVVSQSHYRCLRDAPHDERSHATAVAHRLANSLSLESGNPWLIFENGTRSTGVSANGCVDHLHIHVLTAPLSALNAVSSHIGINQDYQDLAALAASLDQDKDYIFAELQSGDIHSVVGSSLDRQLLRRLLTKALGGNGEWDWRSQPDFERVRAMAGQRRQGFEIKRREI